MEQKTTWTKFNILTASEIRLLAYDLDGDRTLSQQLAVFNKICDLNPVEGPEHTFIMQIMKVVPQAADQKANLSLSVGGHDDEHGPLFVEVAFDFFTVSFFTSGHIIIEPCRECSTDQTGITQPDGAQIADGEDLIACLMMVEELGTKVLINGQILGTDCFIDDTTTIEVKS